MVKLGFLIVVSSPIWMALVCAYAYARRTGARRSWWAAVIVLAAGWAMYGLPGTDSELFLVIPATFISILLAVWARYVMNKRRSDEDAVLQVAEALGRAKGGEE
jgi:hypothetical protein